MLMENAPFSIPLPSALPIELVGNISEPPVAPTFEAPPAASISSCESGLTFIMPEGVVVSLPSAPTDLVNCPVKDVSPGVKLLASEIGTYWF